jgi:hypothetical protein
VGEQPTEDGLNSGREAILQAESVAEMRAWIDVLEHQV